MSNNNNNSNNNNYNISRESLYNTSNRSLDFAYDIDTKNLSYDEEDNEAASLTGSFDNINLHTQRHEPNEDDYEDDYEHDSGTTTTTTSNAIISFVNRNIVIFAAMLASVGGIIFGYDLAVIAGALEPLRQSMDLSNLQASIFVSTINIGTFVGALIGVYACMHTCIYKT